MDDRHGREVLGSFASDESVGSVMVDDARRGRGPGDVDEEGLGDGLAARVVGIEGATDGFVGTEDAVMVGAGRGVASDEAEGQVGGVKGAAKRVGIFEQDGRAQVVNQVLLGDGDEGGR